MSDHSYALNGVKLKTRLTHAHYVTCYPMGNMTRILSLISIAAGAGAWFSQTGKISMITGIVLALVGTLTGLYLAIRSFFSKDSTPVPPQIRLTMFIGLISSIFFLGQTFYNMKKSAKQLKESNKDSTELDKAFEKMNE